jgi:carbamoyltransferase
MGLATYGKPVLKDLIYRAELDNIIKTESKITYALDDFLSETPLSNVSNIPTPTSDLFFSKANFAASIQNTFEQVLMELCIYISQNLTSENLVYTGGCALNATFNGKLLRSRLFENVFIPPMCNDAGCVLGMLGIKNIPVQVYNNFTYDIPIECEQIDEQAVIDWIDDGKVIAWFEGGSEYGPRALGHRSILSRTDFNHINYRVNEIKGREYWRPLSPIVLDQYFTDIFEVESIKSPHKYMLATEIIRIVQREYMKAVCAVDNTSRPMVLEDKNCALYKLMEKGRYKALLNTSFNGPGEPIIETPEQAIQFMNRPNLDDLMLVFVDANGGLYRWYKQLSP